MKRAAPVGLANLGPDWPQDARSEHPGAEKRPAADDLARHHEHAVTGVMQRLRMLGRGGNMRLHHLEDEEVVPLHQRIVAQPALEACVAFADRRRADDVSVLRREPERGELVDLCPGRIADPDHRVGQRGRRQVDDARAPIADQPVAVVAGKLV